MKAEHKGCMYRWSPVFLLSLLCILMLAGCFAAESPAVIPASTPLSFSETVDKVMPSVVYIFVEVETDRPEQFLPASGSGVILRSDGYILTNRHVVENASRAVAAQTNQIFNGCGGFVGGS